MTIAEEIEGLARKAEEQASYIRSEQDTKSVLVVPFIRNVLGFDTGDARQVRQEFGADVMGKNLDKVDYALFDGTGNPVVVIEAKRLKTRLDETVASQLKGYFFATDSAPIGICTNGVQYLFYADLDNRNKMDSEPFLVIDLHKLDSGAVTDLANLIEGGFSSSQLRSTAERIRNRQRIVSAIQDILFTVPDDLVKLVLSKLGEKRFGRRRDEFREDLKSVLSDLRNRRSGAMASDESASVSPPSRRIPVTEETESEPHLPEVTGWVLLSQVTVARGAKSPTSLRIGDSVYEISNWRAILFEIVESLHREGHFKPYDTPIKYGPAGIINSEPVSLLGRSMTRPHRIGGEDLYIETHGSSETVVKRAQAILRHFDIDDADFSVFFGE